MKQYFQENPDVMTRERQISTNINGKPLFFFTNNGLFSCDKVDEASLILVENIPPLAGSLLDLGCGYGFIGIALAVKNAAKDDGAFISENALTAVTFSDVNALALDYAKKNARKNGIAGEALHCDFLHSDGFASISQKFDTIVLNPPIHAGKAVMYRLYEGAAAHLNPNGSFFVVIQKKHGAETTMEKLQDIFGNCVVIYKKKGCYVLQCSLENNLASNF